MKSFVCKHGREIGFEPVRTEVAREGMKFHLVWRDCRACSDEIAGQQLVAIGLNAINQQSALTEEKK